MKKKNGYSLVEIILVMMLLIMVASLVFSLTAAGSRAWMRLTESGNQRTELRTAMSYIDVQLKKSDSIGSVSIENNPSGEGVAIRLTREIKNPTIPDFNNSETWIYLKDGKLCELYTMPGMPLPNAMIAGQPLASADSWEIRVVSDQLLEVTLNLKHELEGNEIIESITRQFFIRSGGLES